MNNAVVILFCFSSVLLTVNVQQVTAGYVYNNGCPPTTAGNVTCQGVGTSQTSDALNEINNNEDNYLLVQFPRLLNMYIISDVSINYEVAYYATLFMDGVIAYVIQLIRNVYLLVQLVGTIRIFTIQNNNNNIGGFDGLRGFDILAAIKLIETPFPYQCSILTPSSELFVPQAGAAKASYVAFDFSAVQSAIVKTYGSSQVNIKQRAPSAKLDSNGNYVLTQPGTTSELQCVVGNPNAVDFSPQRTGQPGCDYALSFTIAAAGIDVGFFIVVKFVIWTREQVLIYFQAYTYPFVINNIANSIFTVCD